MQPFTPTPVNIEECQQLITEGYGIAACRYVNNDYWAGAVKACGGVDKMANMSQIAQIADYIYGKNIGAYDEAYNLTFDPAKATELGLPSPNFHLLSSEETNNSYDAHSRLFARDYSSRAGFDRSNNFNLSNPLVICIGE